MKTVLSLLENYLNGLDNEEQTIEALNRIKLFLHQRSPFKDEPVDCVLWVKRAQVTANDYNPNVMSPSEKKLLETSLTKDGYTQPVVVLPSPHDRSDLQVVDGYHRYLLSRKNALKKRLNGYLPVTLLDTENHGVAEQMAVTIRHNRARGQHQVTAMSDIVRTYHDWAGAMKESERNWECRRMKYYGLSKSAVWLNYFLSGNFLKPGQ